MDFSGATQTEVLIISVIGFPLISRGNEKWLMTEDLRGRRGKVYKSFIKCVAI